MPEGIAILLAVAYVRTHKLVQEQSNARPPRSKDDNPSSVLIKALSMLVKPLFASDKDVKAVFRLSKVLSMDVRPRLSSCIDLAAVNPLSIPTGIAFPVIAVFFITRAADGIGTSSGVIVRPVRLSAAKEAIEPP